MEIKTKSENILVVEITPKGDLIFDTIEQSVQRFSLNSMENYNFRLYENPILTTEDGYECTLDDRVFGVLPKGSWETRFGINAESGILVHNLYDTGGKRYSKNSPWLFFKTKENAEKYIYENKPEFSRKQIDDALEFSKYASLVTGEIIIRDWDFYAKLNERNNN